MTTPDRADFTKALLNPQLWRLEAVRRRRQLEELQGFLARLEAEYAQLETQALAFQSRYEQRLGSAWREVEQLQAELLRALETLARAEGAPLPPLPPQRRRNALPQLPAAVAWPAPPADEQVLVAPSIKDLHRRAAMRLHPDRATSDDERQRREALMRDANLAYMNKDRAALEGLLIASGENPQRLGGFDVHAHWQWLERCEQLAQGRLRVLRAHLMLLRQHPTTVLAEASERALGRGLDALVVMEARLKSLAAELTQQLYIGERLTPRSPLSQQFLAQWQARWGEAASIQPLYRPGSTGGLKGERAASSSS